MRYWLTCGLALLTLAAGAEQTWVEIGVDPEAKYYVDPGSIKVDGDTIRLHKRAVFNAARRQFHRTSSSVQGEHRRGRGGLRATYQSRYFH